ncbi:MAG: hypothetical protein M1378_11265 [Bacteroidetes bacterium]|nr:hypothetical protein [Bacteroidota bacterium]
MKHSNQHTSGPHNPDILFYFHKAIQNSWAFQVQAALSRYDLHFAPDTQQRRQVNESVRRWQQGEKNWWRIQAGLSFVQLPGIAPDRNEDSTRLIQMKSDTSII